MTKRTLSVAFLLGLALGQAELSFAANFRVSPIQVHVSGEGRSTLLTLFNESDRPVRFQITAVTWTQTPEGKMELGPTEDIAFFPKLLELGANQQRNVRIASRVPAGEVEKTYRLFFEEMPPPPGSDDEGARVEVLTKMGVPVFLRAAGSKASPAFDGFSFEDGTLRFAAANRGTAHLSLHSVAVRGLDGEGAEVFSKQRDGWYVLARSERKYEVELSEEECSGVSTFVVDAVYSVPLESGTKTIEATWPAPGNGCR